MKEKEVLSSLIRLMDPLQLINWSCPIDEYDSEIKQIYECYLINNDDNLISKQLDAYFHDAYNQKYILVEEIFNLYVRNKNTDKKYIIKSLFKIWDPLAIDNKTFGQHDYNIYATIIENNLDNNEYNENLLEEIFKGYSPRSEMISIFCFLLTILVKSEF